MVNYRDAYESLQKNPGFITFEGDTIKIQKELPKKVETYALEVFQKFNQIILETREPNVVNDLLALAGLVHEQLPKDSAARAEYFKLQEVAKGKLDQANYGEFNHPPSPPPPLAPPPSKAEEKKMQFPKVDAIKKAVRKLDQKTANLLSPFGLANKDPSFVESDCHFKKFVQDSFSGLSFSSNETKELLACNKEFDTWKRTYLQFCTKLQVLEKALKTPEGEISLESEIEALEQLSTQGEKEFTQFIIRFMSFKTKKEKVGSLEEAKSSYQEQKILSQQATKEVTDELKQFGGIHSVYKSLLINTKKKSGVVWLNALMKAYVDEKGLSDKIDIDKLAEWLKEVAENIDAYSESTQKAVKAALDRVNIDAPDKTLLDYFHKQFPKTQEMKYPLEDQPKLTDEMKSNFASVNHDEGLQKWMTEVNQKGFSQEKGWTTKEGIVQLKEKAVLIFALELDADPEIARQAKQLANAITSYYLINELGARFQAG